MKTTNDKPVVQIGTEFWQGWQPEPYVIVGQTSRSWLVKAKSRQEPWRESNKIAKRDFPGREQWLTKDGQDLFLFKERNKREVLTAVELLDAKLFRDLADYIGYVQPEEWERCRHGGRCGWSDDNPLREMRCWNCKRPKPDAGGQQ